jgi:hypothetical protein
VHDLERAELAAFASMWDGAPEDVAREYGLEVAHVGGAVCGLARALPGVRDLNRVGGADGSTDPAELLRVYAGLEHIVAVSPGSEPLAQRLQDAGYTPGYAWMKFACAPDPDADAPTGLRIETIGPDRAGDLAEPVVAGFGMPPFMAGVIASLVGRPRLDGVRRL